MKTISQAQILIGISVLAFQSFIGCAPRQLAIASTNQPVHAGSVIIQADKTTPKPPFEFNGSDSIFLDEIEHATFDYFWSAVSPETAMVYDRTSSDVISIAGVGFQLAALPIGVERGWITREQGQHRANTILEALENEPSNRKAGLFYHFINPTDASARRVGRELVVSTVDSALLFSGMLVSGEYFQGKTKSIADRLFAQANWAFFLASQQTITPDGLFLSLGWKPHADDQPTGDGELLPYFWLDCGDEHRLATFLGTCAPNPEYRIPTQTYWSLRRQIGWHEGQGHIVWFPYSGALFTSFFAHCFIDYSSLGTDAPNMHHQTHRAHVDWWENARRTVHLHRDRAIENPHGLPTLGPDAWGFSASDGPDGYLVSGQYPQNIEMLNSIPERDFATYQPNDDWGDGIIAPYAPGTSIMFEPELAINALRFAYATTAKNGDRGVWRGSHPNGWGFADAYRLDENGYTDWVAEDFVAISQGPLILGIENARTGLIWEIFMSHREIQHGLSILGLSQNP